MNKTVRFFIPVPWEFYDAWSVDRRVKPTHVLTALYVAARCFEARNTSGGTASVELSTLARLCDVGTEMIRRRLHDLRDWGWLDFEPGDGGDPAWRIWLTGLSLDEPSPPPLHHLSTETASPSWKGLSTDTPEPSDANPQEQRDSSSTTSPQRETRPRDRRDETKREENQRAKKDHVLGETTGRDEASEPEPADWRQLYEELVTEGVD